MRLRARGEIKLASERGVEPFAGVLRSQRRACEAVAERHGRRAAGAIMAVALASRFWGLGCPKIYHEVATRLESFWDSGEPMFRTGKSTSSGRSRRMGANAIEASIVRYTERALKTMPAVSRAKEPPVLPARPPMLWIADIQYQRASSK